MLWRSETFITLEDNFPHGGEDIRDNRISRIFKTERPSTDSVKAQQVNKPLREMEFLKLVSQNQLIRRNFGQKTHPWISIKLPF